MTSLFDGIEDAEIYERGVYMSGGFDGEVEILKTIQNRSRKGDDAFIVDMRIVSGGTQKDPNGAKRSWYVKHNDSFHGNVKVWAAAIMGYESSDKEGIAEKVAPRLKNLLLKAVANPEDNKFIGRRVHLVTATIETRAGGEFTRHDWSPTQGDEEDED